MALLYSPSSLRYVLFVGSLGGEGIWLMVGTWELNRYARMAV